jgi:hypothetical protein
MIGYRITDQNGRHLDGGQTRTQVVNAIHRLLNDDRVSVPRLPKAGRTAIIALPIGKYLGVNELWIKQV